MSRRDAAGQDPRALAARLVMAVAAEGRSLASLIPARLTALGGPRDRALAQELTYGTLRWYLRLDPLARQLLQRPLKTRDRDLHALLLVGLYQLLYMDTPAHAAIHATVEAARALGKGWAAGLVNGVLRNAQRRGAEVLEALDPDPAIRWAHPAWLVEALRRDWPGHWQDILEANNARAPMFLRVNVLRCSRDAYLEQLAQAGIAARPVAGLAAALRLERPVAVDALPGFHEGLVSVQDAAAQRAAPLLAPRPGERVLDACAAPGGKTAHLLELEPNLAELVAIDREPARLERVRENLGRLGLAASLVAADAADPDAWWDGRPFDRILLDAPCSASGVIRRHPDIKLLRRCSDVDQLAETQQNLLNALWPLLAPGGILLYVTCSVLRQENSAQLERFLATQADADSQALSPGWGRAAGAGRQVLPGDDGMDGFYFACMNKRQS
ncbi:MAG TPA: 16S rRNA (cytosine(967)-C(5))-methyltransferase RsmB [Gammaproteobacteria bacterium]|nr:16S rRNA (cytosine(967)-C(5))-methyltransferase RsmB [Gammaproteobacteria bacterium]